ncbi:MAG: hypothetical protein PHS44_02300 [Candidatus Dojkabacteria bacterium]|nr:hypothetical protein [Candidatus Dojkabacteria bacterium]
MDEEVVHNSPPAEVRVDIVWGLTTGPRQAQQGLYAFYRDQMLFITVTCDRTSVQELRYLASDERKCIIFLHAGRFEVSRVLSDGRVYGHEELRALYEDQSLNGCYDESQPSVPILLTRQAAIRMIERFEQDGTVMIES